MLKRFKLKKTIWVLLFIVCIMFGFSFALIPIYNSLCKQLGINGKVALSNKKYVTSADKNSRMVTVELVTTKEQGVPWEFYAKTKKVKIHLGEMTRLNFYAENQSNYTMTVQAIPSITPGIATKFLQKTECFCFTQQTLGPHEAMEMPVLFHIDKELPKNISTITLAYALFAVGK